MSVDGPRTSERLRIDVVAPTQAAVASHLPTADVCRVELASASNTSDARPLSF
jgi:hypothetical protein